MFYTVSKQKVTHVKDHLASKELPIKRLYEKIVHTDLSRHILLHKGIPIHTSIKASIYIQDIRILNYEFHVYSLQKNKQVLWIKNQYIKHITY